MCDSIVEAWDSIEKYNRYEGFYEAVLTAAVEYLQETAPQSLLHTPHILADLLEESKAEGAIARPAIARFANATQRRRAGACQFLLEGRPALARSPTGSAQQKHQTGGLQLEVLPPLLQCHW